MSHPTDDQIRDLLHRAMADAPEPHSWTTVRARADVRAAPPVGAGRRVGYWLAGAACTIGLIAGLVVLMDPDDEVRIDEEPVPTATTSTTSTTTVPQAATTTADGLATGGEPTDDVVARFIAALNDRDLEALDLLSTDEVTVDEVPFDALPSLTAWYEAFDWRWEDVTCRDASNDADVACDLFERNRLTDVTGAERPASVSFTLVDGRVQSVAVSAGLSDYGPNAFDGFRTWVQVNHPGDVARMWTTTNSPVLTAESAALFDQHLTDYTARLRAEIASAERFIAALDARDLTAMEAVSSDELSIDGVEIDGLLSLTAWYEAIDWRWEDATCRVSSIAADVVCEVFERNRLTDVAGVGQPATVAFTVVDGQVTSVETGADLPDEEPD